MTVMRRHPESICKLGGIVLLALLMLIATTPALANTPTSMQTDPLPADAGNDEAWSNHIPLTCLAIALKHFDAIKPALNTCSDMLHDVYDIDDVQIVCQHADLHVRRARLDVHSLDRFLNAYPSARAVLALKDDKFCYVEASDGRQFSMVRGLFETQWLPA